MVQTTKDAVRVEAGEVPVYVAGPDDPSAAPAVLVVPSIFGPAEDLLAQMRSIADVAYTVVMDPFWSVGGGAVPYDDFDHARSRLEGFDREAAIGDVEAVAEWVRPRGNGSIIGVGICFGGPHVLLGAAQGWLQGAVTWHGSRMENVLDRLGGLTAPLRLHFGDADPITPPEVIGAIESCFADHPDCSIVVHSGLGHGFSHEGASFDADAAAAGVAAVRALAERFA